MYSTLAGYCPVSTNVHMHQLSVPKVYSSFVVNAYYQLSLNTAALFLSVYTLCFNFHSNDTSPISLTSFSVRLIRFVVFVCFQMFVVVCFWIFVVSFRFVLFNS